MTSLLFIAALLSAVTPTSPLDPDANRPATTSATPLSMSRALRIAVSSFERNGVADVADVVGGLTKVPS